MFYVWYWDSRRRNECCFSSPLATIYGPQISVYVNNIQHSEDNTTQSRQETCPDVIARAEGASPLLAATKRGCSASHRLDAWCSVIGYICKMVLIMTLHLHNDCKNGRNYWTWSKYTLPCENKCVSKWIYLELVLKGKAHFSFFLRRNSCAFRRRKKSTGLLHLLEEALLARYFFFNFFSERLFLIFC